MAGAATLAAVAENRTSIYSASSREPVMTTSATQMYSQCACSNAAQGLLENLTNATNATNSTASGVRQPTLYYVGLGLALGNCLFVGTSYVIQKKALSRYQQRTGHTGRHAGLGYLREWLWWVGLVLMGVGELANFLAFGFAPASLVTPLEGLTVVVSVILASIFLKENLNVFGQIGIYLCLVGSLIIVLLAPEEKEIATMQDLERAFVSPSVIIMGCLIVILMVLCGAWLGPRWGHRNPFIFLAIASAAGPITVFGCKAIGLAISDTLNGVNQFSYWLTWVMIVLTVICILVQLYYVNRTLAAFSTCIVTPVYFVMFTSSVLLASVIAFSEFSSVSPERAVVLVCGFLVVAAGVILINVFKTEECSWRKVAQLFRASNEAPNSDRESSSSVTNLGEQRKKENAAVAQFRKIKTVINAVRKKRKLTDEEDLDDVVVAQGDGKLNSSAMSPSHSEQNYSATRNDAIESDDEQAIVHDPPFARLDESATSIELRTALTDARTPKQMSGSFNTGRLQSSASKRSSTEKKRERRAKTASKEIVMAVDDVDDDEVDDEPGGAADQKPAQIAVTDTFEPVPLTINGAVHYRVHRKIASDFGPSAAPYPALAYGASERATGDVHIAIGVSTPTLPSIGDQVQKQSPASTIMCVDHGSSRPC